MRTTLQSIRGDYPVTIALDPPTTDLSIRAQPRLDVSPPSSDSESTRIGWVRQPGSSVFVSDPATIPTDVLPVNPPIAIGGLTFGFRLETELGRGAFGSVYLATQPELAERKVVLKVSQNLSVESRALARLQHTNIVPVYSVHREGEFQAVCMPYFGTVTLAELLRRLRGRAHLPQTGSDFIDTFREAATGAPPRFEPAGIVPSQVNAADEIILEKLAAGSYVHACCWLVARLADGLEHAHERGILHRDIKPANVLVTDEGQPMLLDFGVAEEYARRGDGTAVRIGGTLPYMAPEQLVEHRDGSVRADRSCDVYALGLILCELLTRQYPFAMPASTDEPSTVLAARYADRPALRRWNPAVTPGLESIVHTCLAFDPRRRYRTAGALRDDLERFLAHRPMLVAPERSWRERGSKWMTRNRWATSHITLAIAASLVIAALALGMVVRQGRLATLEAADARERLTAAANTAQLTLYDDPPDSGRIRTTLDELRSALASFGLPDAGWEQSAHGRAIAESQHEPLRRELADACLLASRAYGILVIADVTRRDDLAEALVFNALAERINGPNAPRSIFGQRAKLLALADRAQESATVKSKAAATKLVSARDYYLAGEEAFSAGRTLDALELYRQARTIDSTLYWAHYAEGVCCNVLGRWAEARTAFHVAVALQPQSAMAAFCRGQAAQRLNDYAAAEADFTLAIDRQSDFGNAYLARAEARLALQNFDESQADLERAASLDVPADAYAKVRSRLREARGDNDIGAPSPKTADEWINSGLNVLATDKPNALKCFERAVAVEPGNATPRLYAAHVCEALNRLDEARRHLDRAVELNPGEFRAWLGRGLIHARQQHRDDAIRDARAALERNVSPACLYQAACIFGLIAADRPEYRSEAVTYLGIALRGGAGLDSFRTATDLVSIREMPEFQRLLLDHKPTTGP